ncbi:hypothetical protein D3C87_666070 [compost metagenome]
MKLLILKGRISDEKIKVYRSSHRLCDQTVLDKHARERSLQKNGYQRSYILQLEEENAQLKKLVADPNLDKQMLQDVLKKFLSLRSVEQ